MVATTKAFGQQSLFKLGQVVATPGALASVIADDMLAGLRRHASGDWGLVCEDDGDANDAALQHGGRILSVYQSVNGTRFWIITEADRSATTILLPEEY
jgi:hypothetical protein